MPPKSRHLSAFGVAAAVALGSSAFAAQAQAWPAKPIRLIVPYAAGGPTDVIARLVANKVGSELGQAVVVENKAGAGGTIGVDAALKSPPDGDTFALAAPGPLAGMPHLMKAPFTPADVLRAAPRRSAVAMTSTPHAYRDLMNAESGKWRTVVAKGRITLD